MVEIHVAHYPSPELLDDVNRLLPQLSSSATSMTHETLADMLQSSAITLFLASLEGRTVGMLTLALFPIPTGVRAWVEDVVVEESARGNGVGALLTETAIQHAKRFGAKTVDLTSRPTREAANRLYRKVGFVQRETNVYRYSLDD
jgi:GNAT superfamily N-acetyltransferase